GVEVHQVKGVPHLSQLRADTLAEDAVHALAVLALLDEIDQRLDGVLAVVRGAEGLGHSQTRVLDHVAGGAAEALAWDPYPVVLARSTAVERGGAQEDKRA